MRAIFEFDLEDPDDRQAHLRCTKSLNMACALFELAYNLYNDDCYHLRITKCL